VTICGAGMSHLALPEHVFAFEDDAEKTEIRVGSNPKKNLQDKKSMTCHRAGRLRFPQVTLIFGNL
jgi:hypothetical protein